MTVRKNATVWIVTILPDLLVALSPESGRPNSWDPKLKPEGTEEQLILKTEICENDKNAVVTMLPEDNNFGSYIFHIGGKSEKFNYTNAIVFMKDSLEVLYMYFKSW